MYFNILQKKSVCDSVRFRVKESQQMRIVAALLAVDKTLLQRTIRRFEHDSSYKPVSEEEINMLTLIDGVSTVLPNIPGTSGHKLCLRNEIRALVNFQGTPAFFVTINPSDIHHPLVRLFAGEQIQLDDAGVGEELTSWQRKLLAAKNPGACARFFHTMVSNFISIVLRYGKTEKGLLGKCTAYYGTVEAQARGTLHCHMLIWLDGHPAPQKMRDMMEDSDEFRAHMFAWLESIIKSELLGTTDTVAEPEGRPLPRPPFRESPDNIHPGAKPQPILAEMTPTVFQEQYKMFVNELVQRYNWHEHTETCWKYLRSNQERSDENCRMRMDGKKRDHTTLDAETLSIQLRRLHPRIANYNDLVMFVMQANMDIKHIGSGEGAKALIYYVTDYITKSSLPTHLGLAALMYAINSTHARYGQPTAWDVGHDTGALTILVNSMLSRQEISHAQVMSELVGGGNHYTSHKFRLLYYRSFERAVRTYWDEGHAPGALEAHAGQTASPEATHDVGPELGRTQSTASRENSSSIEVEDDQLPSTLEREETVTLSLANGSISALNQQQDYLLRPRTDPFDCMSLYQYAGLTEKVTVAFDTQSRRDDPSPEGRVSSRGRRREERGSFLPTHPDHQTHLVRKRVIWVVPVILGSHIARNDRSEEERESWARTVLILFVPWQTPADLKERGESWMESYARQQRYIPRQHRSIICNMNVLNQCRDARDRARQDRRLATAATLYERGLGNGRSDGDGVGSRSEDEDATAPDPDSLAPPRPSGAPIGRPVSATDPHRPHIASRARRPGQVLHTYHP